MAQVGRFWNSVLATDEENLVLCALMDSFALAGKAGGARLMQQLWADQVVAAVHVFGVELYLCLHVLGWLPCLQTTRTAYVCWKRTTCICRPCSSPL